MHLNQSLSLPALEIHGGLRQESGQAGSRILSYSDINLGRPLIRSKKQVHPNYGHFLTQTTSLRTKKLTRTLSLRKSKSIFFFLPSTIPVLLWGEFFAVLFSFLHSLSFTLKNNVHASNLQKQTFKTYWRHKESIPRIKIKCKLPFN